MSCIQVAVDAVEIGFVRPVIGIIEMSVGTLLGKFRREKVFMAGNA
jgi:hypothetical protein